MHENQIQSRKWLLTINNPQDHGMTHDVIIDRAQKFNPDYFCMADEIGESGTYHTHVFLYSSSPMRFGTVKKRFPTAHIDKANGTAEDNRAYIRKEGKWADTRKSETGVEGTFKEFSELPDEASEKSPKYAKLLQCVKDGMTNQEILAIDPSFAFHLEHIDKLRQDIRFEKERLQRRSNLREHLPRPNATSDAPVKLIFVAIYILGAILIWSKQDEIALTAETTALLSPVASLVMQHILAVYLPVGGVFLTILILYPLGKKVAQDQLRSIGLVNHTDMVPALKRKYKDKQNPRISVWEFSSQGIPLKTWEDKQAAIETILDITFVKMKYGSGKSRILLYTVPARTDLPEVIDWNDKYLSSKPFILALGESFTGPVTVDLVKVPHILLGGSTGSGKSVLLKLLLMQALKKGAVVSIADFKGGVDFPPIWHKQCRMCIEEESTLTLLTELVDELQRRKVLLAASGQPNIDRYNEATGENIPRYIFACDEIAEVLDKTGLSSDQKEVVRKIESKLAMIARQGRAFGIHLILATQRPDANILSGQIKNNVNCRICGRADTILSQIILDSTAAAEQIPNDARGRFLLHDGTLFQAYWFDDANL